MKKSDSERCRLCFIYSENIQHLFFTCLVVQNFWVAVAKYIKQKTGFENPFKEEQVLFGIKNPDDLAIITDINHIILVGKYFIFRCVLESKKLLVNQFIVYCKNWIPDSMLIDL